LEEDCADEMARKLMWEEEQKEVGREEAKAGGREGRSRSRDALPICGA
jgi:hypothetical protein